MKVSAEALAVYDQVNAAWKEAGIPTNIYSAPFRGQPESHADPKIAREFIEWALRYYPGIWSSPISFKEATGICNTWPVSSWGRWTVNVEKGYFDVAHMLSHYVWVVRARRLRKIGHKVPHAHHTLEHAEIEMRFSQKMIEMAGC
jgi:hypothetical protein